MNHSTHGTHLIAEYLECDSLVLNNAEQLESLFLYAAETAGCTIINSEFHTFVPHGVSGIVIISESHLSIHTWPEFRYAAVDMYTCGNADPKAAHEIVLKGLKSSKFYIKILKRGAGDIKVIPQQS